LVVAYTNVADDRDAAGIHFQRYKFWWTKVFFGAGFSTANLLDQKILTITIILK
jgi:hypothetical protein